MKNISIDAIIKDMNRKAEQLEKAKVKIAISGQSGAGKSSIINAIIGEKVAEVGCVETTLKVESYDHNGLVFSDLPGCGTESFPVETYIEKCELLTFDAFIIVTSNRFYENDEWLIKEMVKEGRPVYVVRTKMDESIINEKRDNDLDSDEVYEKVKANIFESVRGLSIKGWYLISSVDGIKNDFEKLLNDIENNLDGIKKQRFILDVTPYNNEVLNSKREAVRSMISKSAWAAAANGINPILGVDVSVDIAILMSLSKKISDTFGVSEKEITYSTNKYGLDRKYITLGKQFSGKFIAKEGIMLLLKKLGARVGAKSVLKYIPFAGQAIAAGIGYKMTDSFGEELLEEAYDLAEKILNASRDKASNYFYENNTIIK